MLKLTNNLSSLTDAPWLVKSWNEISSHRILQLSSTTIFLAQDGIGAEMVAEQLILSKLCFEPLTTGFACGQCNSCYAIKNNCNPDFLMVKMDGSNSQIKIDDVRPCIDFASRTAYFNRGKYILIFPAEGLNLSAANALLKICEEPPSDTHFLFIAHRANRVLPTILSRCVQVRISTPLHTISSTWLKNKGYTQTQCDDALELTAHAPFNALSLLQQDTISSYRNFLDQFMNVAKGIDNPLDAANSWSKHPLHESLKWFEIGFKKILSDSLTTKSKLVKLNRLYRVLSDYYDLANKINLNINYNTQQILEYLFIKSYCLYSKGTDS